MVLRRVRVSVRLQITCLLPIKTAAQLIVGVDVRTAAVLASQDVEELTRNVAAFADSSEGVRLLRDRAAPDQAQVAKWIANAAFAATSKAA